MSSSATWLIQETLEHFIKRGSNPTAVVLDSNYAFDLAKFSILFNSLLVKRLPVAVVRVICFSYQEQISCEFGPKSQFLTICNFLTNTVRQKVKALLYTNLGITN